MNNRLQADYKSKFKVTSVKVQKAKHKTIINYIDSDSESYSNFARELVKNTTLLYQFSPADIHLIVFLDTEDLFDRHYNLLRTDIDKQPALGGKS